eukprot:3941039-Rhodomonas_salina.1
MPLPPYALSTRCPVLISAVLLPGAPLVRQPTVLLVDRFTNVLVSPAIRLRACYGSPAIRLRAYYAISGTDAAYGTARTSFQPKYHRIPWYAPSTVDTTPARLYLLAPNGSTAYNGGTAYNSTTA